MSLYSVRAICNYFLKLAWAAGEELDQMKIEMLCYYAYGWHLALNGGRSLITEHAESGPYGPRFSSLLQAHKRFGNRPVTEMAETHDAVTDKTSQKFLGQMWETYGQLTWWDIPDDPFDLWFDFC